MISHPGETLFQRHAVWEEPVLLAAFVCCPGMQDSVRVGCGTWCSFE